MGANYSYCTFKDDVMFPLVSISKQVPEDILSKSTRMVEISLRAVTICNWKRRYTMYKELIIQCAYIILA